MTKTEWKPTEEMVRLAIQVAPGAYDEPVIDILIAVQPLIAAEALEKAAWLVERLPENDMDTVAAAIRAMIKKEPQG